MRFLNFVLLWMIFIVFANSICLSGAPISDNKGKTIKKVGGISRTPETRSSTCSPDVNPDLTVTIRGVCYILGRGA